VTILGGEKDDWSPTAPCLELVKWSRLNGEPVSIIVYPDSHHGFDIPGAPATNAQARRDALQQVPAFLAHYLQR
jgi:dienelactone hydrolase